MLHDEVYVFELSTAKCCGTEIKERRRTCTLLESCDLWESAQSGSKSLCELAGLFPYVLFHRRAMLRC